MILPTVPSLLYHLTHTHVYPSRSPTIGHLILGRPPRAPMPTGTHGAHTQLPTPTHSDAHQHPNLRTHTLQSTAKTLTKGGCPRHHCLLPPAAQPHPLLIPPCSKRTRAVPTRPSSDPRCNGVRFLVSQALHRTISEMRREKE